LILIIVNVVQAASITTLSQSPLPIIAAPTLAADTVIAVDASAHRKPELHRRRFYHPIGRTRRAADAPPG